MTDEQDELERVATAVADGEPVDWEGEDRANVRLKGKLDRLREIQKIAEVHRTPPSQGTTPDAGLGPTESFDPVGIIAPIPPLPFTRWGHLEIGELLGSGGFGEVYRARDTRLEKEVALKLVRADRITNRHSTQQFLQEARRLARVTHDNVLQVHGADVHEGRAGLWTDLIEGKTLEKILQEEGLRGWEEAALIGRKMCKALAAVHDKRLTHHDVKTGNIMRSETGRYVLMDFSTTTDRVLSIAAEAPAGKRRTRGDADRPADLHPAIGTPGFMAPERFAGKDSGAAADVYSLGVVLYRLVTGRFPVEGETAREIYDKHCRGEMTPLSDVRPDLPDAFVQIVEQALNRNPTRRFRSMGEMDHAIARALGDPNGHTPVPEPPVFPSWAWLRGLVDSTPVRAAVSLLVILLVAIAFRWWPTPLEVDVRIYRSSGSDDRFTARSDEPLAAGATVAPGDHLYLEIKGGDPIYVYVLSHDEVGDAWIMFPLPELDLQNPLPEGTSHRLPGTRQGEEIFWMVSSAGGEEEFLVVASREPLRNFERQIAAIPEAGSIDPDSRGPSTDADSRTPRGVGRLRGIGTLDSAPRPDDGDAWRPLAGIVEGVKERAESDDGIWAWTIRLKNPGAGGGMP